MRCSNQKPATRSLSLSRVSCRPAQVLPDDMMLLAEPAPENLIEAIEQALVRVGSIDPQAQHEKVTHMYSWNNVAARTVKVRGCLVVG